MSFTPKVVIVVGTPGSGKDVLIRAVKDLGVQHAQIVPKHTSRARRLDDGTEMICSNDRKYNIAACDIRYKNFGNEYGVNSSLIWKGLRKGVFQVVVISNIEAINRLKECFGALTLLVYVHSEISADAYLKNETGSGSSGAYVRNRVARYQAAFNIYLKNLLAFDHVLIYSGIQEDLFDQIFRIFRAYERQELQ
jgi:ribose 1,5-bisphosphokinase PhnN